jgi:hypothetical protein
MTRDDVVYYLDSQRMKIHCTSGLVVIIQSLLYYPVFLNGCITLTLTTLKEGMSCQHQIESLIALLAYLNLKGKKLAATSLVTCGHKKMIKYF